MKMLKKLKSGNFWVSLISAGVLIAEGVFDFEIQTEYLNQILLGLMGILTLFGIVSDHGEKETILTTGSNDSSESTKKEESVSNVKSICDTISLLLNKVSISTKEGEFDFEKIFESANEVNLKDDEKIKEAKMENFEEKSESVAQEVNEVKIETNESFEKCECEEVEGEAKVMALEEEKIGGEAKLEKPNNIETEKVEMSIIN